MAQSSEASIIEVIQEMVRSGESEQRIISTLQGLGIEPQKAKRLLLLGESDTFGLLKREISKIVQSNMEKEKPGLLEVIKAEVERKGNEMTEQIEKRALHAFKDDQSFIENQAVMFQSRVNQSVNNILQLNQETKQHIAELNERLGNTERDVWAMKYRVFGSRVSRIVSKLLIGLEAALAAATIFLVFTVFGQSLSLQFAITIVALAVIIAAIIYLVGIRT